MNPENEIDKTEALEPVETAAANVAEARGGAYRRTGGSTSGSNTYRGTTSGGSGSAPKPNLSGGHGCGNSCPPPSSDGLIHH